MHFFPLELGFKPPQLAFGIFLTCDILCAFCSRRVNVGCGPAEERVLLTGLHAVADIYCENCKTTLGWKYVRDRLQLHLPLVCVEALFQSARVFLHDSVLLLDSRRTNHVLQQVKTVRLFLLNVFWLDLGAQMEPSLVPQHL